MLERPESVQSSEIIKIPGRVLYLTKDPDLIRAQIEDKNIGVIGLDELRDSISTDEIIPSRASMAHSDATGLGRYLLTGIKVEETDLQTGRKITKDLIQPGELVGKFDAIAAGTSFGRGSSREHAQLALRGAGISLVVASSVERIFRENCINYGIPILETRKGSSSDSTSQEIIDFGGLLPYTKARLEGRVRLPEVRTPSRPMTIAEKIIASHARTNNSDEPGVEAVKPNDVLFVFIDSGYAYELQSVISQEVLEGTFGNGASVRPGKFILFEDHLALMDPNGPIAQRHIAKQREFAHKNNLKFYPVTEDGVEGICHTVMLERHIFPGDLVLGNDSHTCMGGAANALAIGKGASEFAAALLTEDIPIKVPESIRFNLEGQLPPGVTSKDLMLYILSLPQFRDKDQLIGSNRVFEFGGSALDQMPFDDQVVLTNMAIEGQGFTGIIEPNRPLIEFIKEQHDLSEDDVKSKLVYPDQGAEYSHTFDLDLSRIERMISLPGDTQNGIPLSEVSQKEIHFAYIGSCTGGKLKDLQEVAKVLQGRRVSPNVRMKIQASSLPVLRQARELGLIEIFEEAGAEVILPGCGDCMSATDDANDLEQVVISDTNRNFPGRMGKNRTVYLASPATVAASALLGKIAEPQNLP